MRVQREIARRLSDLDDRGLLRVRDVERAAIHFSVLVTAGIPKRPYPGSRAASAAEVRETVTAGVDAFLDGYGAHPRPSAAKGAERPRLPSRKR